MRQTRPPAPRGFTLLEVMLATSLSLLVLAGGITAGVYLQRRGILEERTMETQNASRAARDLLVPALQRAGAGFGRARLNVGGNGALPDQRYAVWVTTNAAFVGDSTFAAPTGVYAGLISDAVEIWDADTSRAVQLNANASCGNNLWDGTNLCANNIVDGGIPASTLAVVTNPEWPTACVGVVGAGRTANSIAWSAGVPSRPALPAGSECSAPNLPADVLGPSGNNESLLIPLNVRAYRVNWKTGRPVLEMDPDGSMGPATYQPLAQDIERIKVRLGLYNPSNLAADAVYFPDTAAGRPGVDQCTNATCWALLPGDAGTVGANETGPGSARDELMRRVRLVEVLITARTLQPDVDAVRAGANGSTTDAEGNPVDGYKRRHVIQRIAPRNFALSGG